MVLKIYLIRHGETDYNANGSDEYGQPSKIPLNDIGILQSYKLAKRLKNVKFDKIYTSDMRRAKQTTEIVCKEIGMSFIEDKRLREYQYGSVKPSSEKWIEKYKAMLGSGKSKYEIRPFGGENIWDLIKRVQSFLKDLEKENGTIVIVSHSGVNAALMNLSQKRSKDEFLAIKQDNVCINILGFNDDKWNIQVINDSAHISDIKPTIKRYENQDKIRNIAKEYVLEKLGDVAEELFLTGDIINKSFGIYDRPYMRYKGSVVNVYAILKEGFEIPQKWKISILGENINRYEISEIKVEGVKHKVNLTIVKDSSDIPKGGKEKLI